MATCGLFRSFSFKNPKKFGWSLTNQEPRKNNERRHVRFSPWYMYFMLLRNFPDQKYVSAPTVLTRHYSLQSCWNFTCELFVLTANPRTTSGARPRGSRFASAEATRFLAASHPPQLKQKNSHVQSQQSHRLLLVTITYSKRWHSHQRRVLG